MTDRQINSIAETELTAFDNLVHFLNLPLATFTDNVYQIYKAENAVNGEAFEEFYTPLMRLGWMHAQRELVDWLYNHYTDLAKIFDSEAIKDEDFCESYVMDWAWNTADWLCQAATDNADSPLPIAERLNARLQATVARHAANALNIDLDLYND